MPWPRSELTIQASNEFGLDLKVPWAQLLVTKRYIRVTENEVGQIGRWTRGAGTLNLSPKVGLATNDDRAIDLSCRACGAGAWALGLDSRWGLRSAPFSPPTSDYWDAWLRHCRRSCFCLGGTFVFSCAEILGALSRMPHGSTLKPATIDEWAA